MAGSIGTRGPGEKKLELDRRLIKDRIVQLGRELEDIEGQACFTPVIQQSLEQW